MYELLDIELEGYRFKGVFDPQRPDQPAMVLLQSALEVLGFIRKSPDDTTPPITQTVIVCHPTDGVYGAYAVEVVDLGTVREAIKTKKQMLEEWQSNGY